MSLITKNEDIIVVSKNDLDYVLMDKKTLILYIKFKKTLGLMILTMMDYMIKLFILHLLTVCF